MVSSEGLNGVLSRATDDLVCYEDRVRQSLFPKGEAALAAENDDNFG